MERKNNQIRNKEISSDELLAAIKQMPRHRLTPKQLEAMEKDIYDDK